MLTWEQGNGLVSQLGGERRLRGPGGRVKLERTARGWSQETLAAKMADARCPIQQSAISKIEAARGSATPRAVTLDELIAFSRVFEIPVGDLLLPPGAAAMVQGLQDLAAGPQLRRELVMAQSRYDQLLERVVAFAGTDLDVVLDHVQDIIDRHQDDTDPNDSVEHAFAREVTARLDSDSRKRAKK